MSRARRARWTIGGLVLASGATSLCYEVLWSRLIAIQFGVSIFGIAVTVSAFLLGLGGGALLASPKAERMAPRQALRAFGVLEAAVSAFALALPALQSALQPALDALAPHLGSWQWRLLQGACAWTILCAPASALGAGFAFALRAMRAVAEDALGLLYGLNCLGAAGGSLLALILLAGFGWSGAVYAAAACAMLVAVLAWLAGGDLARIDESAPRAPRDSGHTGEHRAAPHRGTVLVAYVGVGACALALELAWTRLYGVVLLRTEYVLAMLLSVFILGTALGSLFERRMARAPWADAAIPIVACAWTLLGLWLLPAVSRHAQALAFDSFGAALAIQYLALCALTLPVCAALGAWLPLLGRGLDMRANRGDAVRLYGGNCVGGALGALATVAIGFPLLGATACVALCALALLLFGAILSGRPALYALALPAALGAWLLHSFPSPAELLPSAAATTEIYRYEDAITINHVTQDVDGQRTLLTDMQRMDASTDTAAVRIQTDQTRLALLLHPDPHRVLFLGLGTGISAAGSLAYAGLERTAVEISPGAIEAARTLFAPVNGDVCDSTRIVHDDARHFLVADRGRYDVIDGDLFHPDLAGMGVLLSVEQFARVRARLAPDGIFIQWLALNQFDRKSLRTVLRGFERIFPGAHLYLDGLHLALVGSVAPLAEGAAIRAGMRAHPPDFETRATGSEGAATWLGRYWGPIAAGIGPVQSEMRPVVEFRLARLHFSNDSPLTEVLEELLRQRPERVAAADQLGIDPRDRAEFFNAYAASELAVQSWLARLRDSEAQSAALTRLAYESNPRDHWIQVDLADDILRKALEDGSIDAPQTLERILRIDPNQLECLTRLWRLERAAGRLDSADRTMRRIQAVAPLYARNLRAAR